MSSDFAVLDIQNDDNEIGDLHFQDFGQTQTQPLSDVKGREQTFHFSDFPESPESTEEQQLLEEQEGEKKTGPSFWTFEFYQQFFDIESGQVGDRIIWSMVPKPGVNYLQTYIRPKPDLYGPFWICVTLIFTTAITGNLANYIQNLPNSDVWRYDFHKVTFAATAIFTYAWLVPLLLWAVVTWRGSRADLALVELLCIYGYSLSIFVPVSILWIVPVPWLQWCIAIVAPVLSGAVLVRTVWPTLAHETKQIAIGIAVIILVLHATLALGFMLYFFTPPANLNKPNLEETSVPNEAEVNSDQPAKEKEAAKEPPEAKDEPQDEKVKENEEAVKKKDEAVKPEIKANESEVQKGKDDSNKKAKTEEKKAASR
ncbi:protein YIPF1-like [Oratosquilla oratoria]|uniref:protein YIPF1-like n=1 Tax=Oratosquilla oratoria TaxID=337810 RepID=UPI003F75FF56